MSARSPLQRLRLLGLRSIGTGYPKARTGRTSRRILLIRPDHLGDVLLLTPALHSFAAALPNTHRTLLLGPWGAPALQGNTDIDAVESCLFPGFDRQAKSSHIAPYRVLFETARQLRGRFDTAVVLRFDHWWGAWLAAAAGIPRRIGYAWPETAPFLTEQVPYQPGRHEARQNARLLETLAPGIEASLGPSRYTVKAEDAAWARDRLAGLSGVKVAIHPGAGALVKQWPSKHWAHVAAQLRALRGAQIILTGGAGEVTLVQGVAAALPFPVVDLAGQTAFRQLAAVYSQCDLVLGSDSGPLHLAVAAGARTLHLYGPVPAAKFGPWGDPARNIVLESPFACVPCDRLAWPRPALPLHGCMAAIQPDDVVAAALQLI